MRWSMAVGAMDGLSGLLLVVAPALVLSMLGIAPPTVDALVFLRWMGVFVGGIGLSYALILGDRHRGETIWMFTSLVRGLVAVFVAWQIVAGTLAPAWAVVALTDFVVAVVQMTAVRADWWEEKRR
jgi:hypothetical protein